MVQFLGLDKCSPILFRYTNPNPPPSRQEEDGRMFNHFE